MFRLVFPNPNVYLIVDTVYVWDQGNKLAVLTLNTAPGSTWTSASNMVDIIFVLRSGDRPPFQNIYQQTTCSGAAVVPYNYKSGSAHVSYVLDPPSNAQNYPNYDNRNFQIAVTPGLCVW